MNLSLMDGPYGILNNTTLLYKDISREISCHYLVGAWRMRFQLTIIFWLCVFAIVSSVVASSSDENVAVSTEQVKESARNKKSNINFLNWCSNEMSLFLIIFFVYHFSVFSLFHCHIPKSGMCFTIIFKKWNLLY